MRTSRDSDAPDGVLTRIVPGVVDVVVLSARPESAPSPVSGRSQKRARWRTLVLQRGANTRCTGAWELVHGRIERGERPEDAAVREVMEETGLATVKLYSITTNAFYLHRSATVQLAIVFAAVVVGTVPVALGPEHAASEWHSFRGAARKVAWPREREALAHVQRLLRGGDAGAVEDVLCIF